MSGRCAVRRLDYQRLVRLLDADKHFTLVQPDTTRAEHFVTGCADRSDLGRGQLNVGGDNGALVNSLHVIRPPVRETGVHRDLRRPGLRPIGRRRPPRSSKNDKQQRAYRHQTDSNACGDPTAPTPRLFATGIGDIVSKSPNTAARSGPESAGSKEASACSISRCSGVRSRFSQSGFMIVGPNSVKRCHRLSCRKDW